MAAVLNHRGHQSINQCVTFPRRASKRPARTRRSFATAAAAADAGAMTMVTYAHVRPTCISISAEMRTLPAISSEDAPQSNILSQLPRSLMKLLARKSE